MRVGDIEYTRHVTFGVLGATSIIVPVDFAVALKFRPVLTRVQSTIPNTSAIVETYGVFIENGNEVPAGLTVPAMLTEARLIPLRVNRRVLVTSGFPETDDPHELNFWKILSPNVSLHAASFANPNCTVILHYRFAELTDDEIVSIAQQRAQF